jgi:hypothetical protein
MPHGEPWGAEFTREQGSLEKLARHDLQHFQP